MLLSDRDIKAEISAGRVKVEPFDGAMIQPSSVDVRLDRFFRVFEHHKYSVIDPSIEQSDLTREVAHGVERKSAPLTTFLLGYAAGAKSLKATEVKNLIDVLSNAVVEWETVD